MILARLLSFFQRQSYIRQVRFPCRLWSLLVGVVFHFGLSSPCVVASHFSSRLSTPLDIIFPINLGLWICACVCIKINLQIWCVGSSTKGERNSIWYSSVSPTGAISKTRCRWWNQIPLSRRTKKKKCSASVSFVRSFCYVSRRFSPWTYIHCRHLHTSR